MGQVYAARDVELGREVALTRSNPLVAQRMHASAAAAAESSTYVHLEVRVAASPHRVGLLKKCLSDSFAEDCGRRHRS